MTSRELCNVADVPPGEMLTVPGSDDGSPDILLCNVDGTIYAIDNLCSHGASALSEGTILGCEIECALHKGRFDLATGKATRRPAKKPINAYECSIEQGVVYLRDAAA